MMACMHAKMVQKTSQRGMTDTKIKLTGDQLKKIAKKSVFTHAQNILILWGQ